MTTIDQLPAILTSFAYRSEYFSELDGMLETVRKYHPDWPIVVGRGPVGGYDLPTLEVDSPFGKSLLTLPLSLNLGSYGDDWRKITMMKGWWVDQVWRQFGGLWSSGINRVIWLDADARLRGPLDIEVPEDTEVIAGPWDSECDQTPGYSFICSGMVLFQGARQGKVEKIIDQWSSDCLENIRNLPPPTVPWLDSDQDILTRVLNRDSNSTGDYMLLKLDLEKYGSCPIAHRRFARQSLINHWGMSARMKMAPESRNAHWPPPEEYRKSAVIGDPVPGLVSTAEHQVILQLQETRRDEKMSAARDWFATRFFPHWAEDVRDILANGQDHRADFKMVISYVEMAASFLIRQTAELDLLQRLINDVMLVWVRMEGHVRYVRQILNLPDFLQNVEQLARIMPAEVEIARQVDNANRRRQHIKSVQPYLRSAWGKSESEQQDILRDYEAVCLNTLLGMASICNLEVAARHVIAKKLAGAYVECGVWKGGATAYWARSFLRNGGDPDQSSLFCFDSFEGMPHITTQDGDNASKWLHNRPLAEVPGQLTDGALIPTSPTLASEFECRAVVEASGFRKERIHIVKGWFQDTLPQHKAQIGPIAVLRLDSDFYHATKFCLSTLYEHVVPNGMIIIDDYEIFGGCKQAVDEFVESLTTNINLIYYGEYGCFFFKPL